MFSQEAFEAWKGRPETADFLAFLQEVREDLKERWAGGETLGDAEHAIAIVYGDIIGLDYERDVQPFYARKYGTEEQNANDDISE